MKKLLFLIAFPLIAFSQSNNVSTSFGNLSYVSQTLTASIDTMDVVPNSQSKGIYNFITVVANSTAVDTIQVWVLGNDGATWSQNSLIDLNGGTTVTTMILSTTQKEWIINNPQAKQIRLISTSNDASTSTVLVQGKYGVR